MSYKLLHDRVKDAQASAREMLIGDILVGQYYLLLRTANGLVDLRNPGRTWTIFEGNIVPDFKGRLLQAGERIILEVV
jgi:hypothetical protein